MRPPDIAIRSGAWLLRVLLSTVASLPNQLDAQSQWEAADKAVVRYSPSRFASLPAAVRSDLEARGCRIPQISSDLSEGGLHNVIKGAFTGQGKRDWAVLCSIRHTSRVLIYGDGRVPAADSLAKAPDRDHLQTLRGGRPGYSRRIGRADAEHIRRMAAEFNGPSPPPILDHEGIEDIFVGKASTIFYFDRGRWLQLQGID
jgi:hypothetical protein